MVLTETFLASVHHLFVFAMPALLAAEWALLAQVPDPATIRRLAFIDLAYALVALAVVAAGIARIYFGLKPWAFYSGNPVFWAKMAVGTLIGLASIIPTVRFLHWRNRLTPLSSEEVASTRRWVVLEIVLFVLLPVCAAAMARGIGYSPGLSSSVVS